MQTNDYNLSRPAYSINEALAILPLGRTSIYAAIKSGALKATKYGNKTLLLAPHIAEFLSSLPSMSDCASPAPTKDVA